jgi:signal transduction histidine kinase
MQNIADVIVDMQASGFGQIRLTKAPLHMENLIDEAIDRHRERANERKISLISKHSSKKLIVEADRSRIIQVLDNLLANAVKHCSAGDIVTISIRETDDKVCVTVSDTGPGLDDKVLKRLFQKDPKQPAVTGSDTARQGLQLCRQLIEQHQGTIDACNNEQHGARFRFCLPLFKLRPVS